MEPRWLHDLYVKVLTRSANYYGRALMDGD